MPKEYFQNFMNLQASSNADTFVGLYALETYDSRKYSERCDAVDSCTAVNTHYERDQLWSLPLIARIRPASPTSSALFGAPM